MADGEHFTVYDAETQQPLMVTVGGGGDDHRNITYITHDNTHISQQDVGDGQNHVFTDITSAPMIMSQQMAVRPQAVTQQVVQQATIPVTTAATAATTSTPIPQMLFLNQVNVNGQTSFVLVDATNKPVQLPQGIQVINLPQPQSTGNQHMAMPGESGEEPLYVNAKQYHRILKRRQARAKLEAHGKIPKERQKYMYESRHKHALNRQRGTGGVFVGVDETSPTFSSHNMKSEMNELHTHELIKALSSAS